MFILLMILSIIFIAVAGISEAIMDKVQFHWHKSIFQYNPKKYPEIFWNPYQSWKNKYADETWTTPKFPGSTGILVFVTDAWHLFKFVRNLSTSIAVMLALISLRYCNIELHAILLSFLITSVLRIVYGLMFTLFFNKILQFKNVFNINPNGNIASNDVSSDWMDKINGLK